MKNKKECLGKMRKQQYQCQPAGLTLVELLVVITIVSIMTLISVPNFITTLRNYRLRASSMDLLAAVRETRTQAMSYGRRFKFTVNTDNYTYTRERLPFKQINLMKLPIEEYLYEETTAELDAINLHPHNKDVPFNHRQGIVDIDTIPAAGVNLIFNPSGTVEITGAGFASLKLYGTMFGYEVRVYKGGQINLLRVELP